jgi:hypothetical protein
MGNPVRGIVTITVSEVEYNLRLGINEWCALEEEMGKSIFDIQKELQESVQAGSISMQVLRSFFKAMLSGSKPGITREEAGELMTDLGIADSLQVVMKVISASAPEVKEPVKKQMAAKPVK